MRAHTILLAALPLVLTGCGSDSPQATQPSASASSATPSRPASTPPATSHSPSPSPTAPSEAPTTRVRDCYDASCLLVVSEPVTIRLNAKKFHYPKMIVVSVTSKSLTFQVPYPQGGGSVQSLGVGGGGSFGFRDFPSMNVRLVSIKKSKALLSLSPESTNQSNP